MKRFKGTERKRRRITEQNKKGKPSERNEEREERTQ